MPELRITLPFPSRTLSPNGRSHWRTKAKAVKAYRKRAADEAMVAAYENRAARRSMPWSKATISVTCYHKTARHMDEDNIVASLKPAFDGLVSAGILTDDRDVTVLPPVRLTDRENPRVELVIRKGAE